MRRNLLVLSALAAVAAIASSLFPPRPVDSSAGNRAILHDSAIDPQTLALFERACRNCHSENTEWPWYGRIPPASWILSHDVQEARSHMNLSRWRDYSLEDRVRLLTEIGAVIRNRAMPPQRYLLLHPEARLSDEERRQIYDWTRAERSRLKSAPRPPG
jgi:hypothetical protein